MARGPEEEEDMAAGDLFADPPGYYPSTPPPTTEQHALGRSGVQLTLHLVGHSVLEAHRLWNGSRVLADYLEEEEEKQRRLASESVDQSAAQSIIRGKTVLELGAGAALPGIVCGLVLGARQVVVTDYPDPDLVATMRKNIAEAEAGAAAAKAAAATTTTAEEGPRGPLQDYVPGTVVADGFVWGGDPVPMLAHLGGQGQEGYDVLLLADLLFRHAEHAKLAQSVAQMLRRSADSRAYVFFTSYRPWLRHKDLAFFGDAAAAGLIVEHLLERRLEHPPLFFANDPGDVAVRSTVSGYALRWPRQTVVDKTDGVEDEDPQASWRIVQEEEAARVTESRTEEAR